MPNRLQEAATNAMTKLPYAFASMALPRILPAPEGSDPKMRAGFDGSNGGGPIYVGDEKNWNDPAYTPQLLGHELYHDKIGNLPPKMRAEIPSDNPNDPYNEHGRASNLKKVGGNPLKLPNEEGAADVQDMIAARQRGEKLDPVYQTFENNIQALPESVMRPTDPNQKGINTMARDPGLPKQPVWGMSNMLHAEKILPVKPDSSDSAPDFIPASADDTPDFIPAEQSANPSPVAKMSAAKPEPWLNQVDEDLRQGGNRTFIGRTLGHLQGNGEKGYSGLESGVSPETADFMGSVPLGTVKMAQGASEIPQHPLRGMGKMASGALQAATIPSAFMGGPAADAAADALPEIIPTKAGAGKLFESVMNAAKDEPVSFTRSMPHLERTQQLASAGAAPVRPADLLYQRLNTVNPVPYGEARDFASNLSRMSAAEKMSTNPQMAREAKMLSHALNGDIGEAADNAGVGDDYRNAMSQYRRAARNTEMAKTAGKAALKYVIPSGVGYEAYKHLTK